MLLLGRNKGGLAKHAACEIGVFKDMISDGACQQCLPVRVSECMCVPTHELASRCTMGTVNSFPLALKVCEGEERRRVAR